MTEPGLGEGADDIVHVVPADDLVDHETTGDDCVCGPSLEIVIVSGEPDAHLYVHHSLDGREALE